MKLYDIICPHCNAKVLTISRFYDYYCCACPCNQIEAEAEHELVFKMLIKCETIYGSQAIQFSTSNDSMCIMLKKQIAYFKIMDIDFFDFHNVKKCELKNLIEKNMKTVMLK